MLPRVTENGVEAGEVGQLLRSCAAFAEDLASGASQPSVSLALEDPVPFSGLHGYQACLRCTDIEAVKPPYISEKP